MSATVGRTGWASRVGSRRLLTVDDTVAQERIAEGVSPDEAFSAREAHSITRWIGADAESTEPRITDLEVTEPGLLVVCTDGLWNYFEDPDDLARIIPADASTTPGIARMADRCRPRRRGPGQHHGRGDPGRATTTSGRPTEE